MSHSQNCFSRENGTFEFWSISTLMPCYQWIAMVYADNPNVPFCPDGTFGGKIPKLHKFQILSLTHIIFSPPMQYNTMQDMKKK